MKKTKKYLALGAAALGLIAVLANPGCSARRTGWVEEDGQYYYYNDRGRMVTGWLVRADGSYYLMDDGVRAAGWQKIDGKNYYFDEYGLMCTGWKEINGVRYLLGSDGAQCFGLVQYAGRTCYLDENGVAITGWAEVDGRTYYFLEDGFSASGLTAIDDVWYAFDADGVVLTGQVELNGKIHHMSENGAARTGWQELNGSTCYLRPDGSTYDGWLEDGGHTYFINDGIRTTGILKQDGKTWFFDSQGRSVYMVNPWNSVPTGADNVEVASVGGDHYIAVEAKADFSAMVSAMQQAGLGPIITSSYRTGAKQQSIFDERMAGYMAEGMTEEEAYVETATSVAIPGTSEHQLGLAMDMTDAQYNKLDEGQMETPTQLWLIENSWKYGFILRYPNGKSHITGIIYEPWHYRYVGKELAAELYELNVTMEEYFDMLTEDKTLTASNPENGNTMK